MNLFLQLRKKFGQENTEDCGAAFLLILFLVGLTFWIFIAREYHGGYLFWHILAGILFGLFFGRRREKRNWIFCLAGAGLLGIWSFALISLNPPIKHGLFIESFLNPFKLVNLHEFFIIRKHFSPFFESTSGLLVILLEGVYLLSWTARFCSARKRGALLRFCVFLTLPAILLPPSLTLIAPFLPEESYQYCIFLFPALLTSVCISLALILTVLFLAILKVRFGWQRLLTAYGILILISIAAWGSFYVLQLVRRTRMLDQLAAEGRPMTLDAFYARQKNAKDGTEKISELFDMMKNPEFDTGDFPNNSSWSWIGDPSLDTDRKRARKEQMIRLSESLPGEKFSAGIAGLAKYDQIRFAGNYMDFNHIFPVFNKIRALVRTGTGRAAIAHYTGKTEQILPRLKALTSVSRLLRHQPWLIAVLIHGNLDLILGIQVIQLGPDGPQYADDYHFFLNWVQNQDYTHSWNETEISAELLKHYDKHSANLYPAIRWLIRPLLIESAFYYLKRSLRREKYFAAHHDFAKDDPAREGYLKVISSKGCLETALALKLFRSLHGKYPESTAVLVPEILPKLPLDPVSGKPFRYVLKKDNFELFSAAFKRPHALVISKTQY